MKGTAIALILAVVLLAGCMQSQNQGPSGSTPAAATGDTNTAKPADDYKEYKNTDEIFNTMEMVVSSLDEANPSAAAGGGQFIAKASGVPPGTSLDFVYNDDKAILVNIDGQFAAYVNKCTHLGCPTSLSGGTLNCPCHGSVYNPKSGGVIKGPAQLPLTTIKIAVRGDSIYAL